ncbi:glycosyltransferase family 1 protein [Dyella sp. M7H15-1]|uniref:glycosyltransferase family 4 protein n=1 Tax=Dyella sp. M7H15-1 TaxID=2501295 RepID=UPI0010050C89|nr:glycosyltransferase [Dyella sp. M7H15-1]QAU24998.1 glycosyltransferase family 1 protein [Dyella sp. M7H15-1]
MNIVLFTPALKTSAIGRMVSRVASELIKWGHVISVVRSEDIHLIAEATHDFGVIPIAWNDDEMVRPLMQDADFVVYQIGDNYSFHRGCLEWLARKSGVVCLHDFYVAHLFLGWARDHASGASQVVERWYGKGAPSAFFSAASTADFIRDTHQSMPMTEWVCSMATGVITHSSWGISRVKEGCAGPVQVVPLAYDVGDTLNQEVGPHNVQCDASIKILTVGHVNPNKRVASVIGAIKSSQPLRKRCNYQVVGPIQVHSVNELAALARNGGVRLRIHGEVDSQALARMFQLADIVCCLRWPSLEAASASAIEAMMHGKAVVVTNTGFYSELPDDCVIKVDPMNEVASLRVALERLAFDDDLRQTLGTRARAWSTNTFTAHNYARQLAEMGKMAARSAPVIGALRHFASVLESWGGKDIDMDEIVHPLQLFQDSDYS